jgi:hypothetical protein
MIMLQALPLEMEMQMRSSQDLKAAFNPSAAAAAAAAAASSSANGSSSGGGGTGIGGSAAQSRKRPHAPYSEDEVEFDGDAPSAAKRGTHTAYMLQHCVVSLITTARCSSQFTGSMHIAAPSR